MWLIFYVPVKHTEQPNPEPGICFARFAFCPRPTFSIEVAMGAKHFMMSVILYVEEQDSDLQMRKMLTQAENWGLWSAMNA